MKSVLFLVHRIPYPPNKGDKIRSYHIFRFLCEHYKVYLGAFVDDPDDWQYTQKVAGWCEDACFIPLNPRLAKFRSLSAIFRGEAMTLPYYRNSKLSRWLSDLGESTKLDASIIFSSSMAQYRAALGSGHGIRIIDYVDVDSEKWLQYSQQGSWFWRYIYRREGRLLRQAEERICQDSDVAVFVSRQEAALFRRIVQTGGAKIVSIENGVDTEYFSPERQYDNPYTGKGPVLLFTGAMDYWANIEAVRWFTTEVFPLLKKYIPALRFYIVGSRPSAEVHALAESKGVTVTGSVPDVRPYLAYADMAVIPLRIARGIQNKVLEAFAMQVPVVATSAAMEGIACPPEIEMLVADSADAMSVSIRRVLEGKGTVPWGEVGRNYVLEKHVWRKNLSVLDRLIA